MLNFLLVALGGAVGSMARYGAGKVALAVLPASFPFGTLAVNIVGSFLIGCCVHALPHNNDLRLLTVTGLIGGFTTFSAFSVETLGLLRSPQPLYGYLYIALSVLLSLAAVYAGSFIKS